MGQRIFDFLWIFTGSTSPLKNYFSKRLMQLVFHLKSSKLNETVENNQFRRYFEANLYQSCHCRAEIRV